MTDILIDVRKGTGSAPEILFGTVTFKPTLAHTRGTSVVLPAPTTYDLVDGKTVATNVQPTPEPVEGKIEWGYEVTFKDRHSKTYSFLVGVPDSTSQVNFNVLPRYFETAPPLFGQGPAGPDGEAATVEIGSVSSGTTPSVSNSGTNTDAVLDFVLPKGDKGDPGDGVPEGGSALQIIQKNPEGTETIWVNADKSLVGLGQVDNTSDTSKPVSTPQKTYIDQSNTLAYQSKSVAEAPSTYPEGVTTGLFSTAQGWPKVSQATNFVTVTTYRGRAYSGSTYQTAAPYQYSPGDVQLIRYAVSGSVWGEWEVNLTSESGKDYFVGKEDFAIFAKDFGAQGSGVANDTASIQAALDYANGLPVKMDVLLNPGIYNVGELFLGSDTNLVGLGKSRLNRVEGNNILNVVGEVGPEVEISAVIAPGSKAISTKTAHGLSVGDIIYLKSQRDSVSDDAGDNWRLGYPTPGSGACPFAEFLTVKSVPSATQITTTTATLFPSYRPDATQESAPTARPSATIQKVSAAKNVTIKDLEFSGAPAQAVYTSWATNINLENLTFRTTFDRPAYTVTRSYSVNMLNCKVYYPQTDSAQIYLRNAFKVISSQGVDIDNCYVENGSQCFDFTYSADWGPSFNCTLRNSRTQWAQTNGATSHGGTYAIHFQNNNFDNCLGSGISIRSRESQVVGNSLFHAYDTDDRYGIRLYEGWAVDCIIENNIVHGFGYGFDVMDAPDQGEKFRYIGAIVSNNAFINCNVSIAVVRSSTNPYRGESGVRITGNNITKPRAGGFGIQLGHHVYGAAIVNNNLNGSSVGSTAIRLDLNCNSTRVDQNDIYDWTSRGIDHRGFDSPDLTVSRVMVWGNLLRRVSGTQNNNYVATGGGTWGGYSFHGIPTTATSRTTVTGSRGSNEALASLLGRLSTMGIITNDSTA